jgi:hypothetical protein
VKLEEIAPKQGGGALKDVGVQRIKRGDIASTVAYVAKLAGIPKKDLHALGSTGKLPDSGDIDLAVDSTIHDPDHVHQKLIAKIGDDHAVVNKGLKVSSYAIPIRGDKANGLVQVDLMYTPNVDWAKFSYHSEGANSKYKGAVRNRLLRGVAAAIQQKGTDEFVYTDDGSLIVRAGRALDLSQGLRRIFQHRTKRKDGKGYVKTMKSIPIEDFKELYPSVQVKGGQITIDDPEKVVKVLFGSGVTPKDVRSAEQVIQLIKKKFDLDMQDKIFGYARDRAKPLRNKMRLPKELMDDER